MKKEFAKKLLQKTAEDYEKIAEEFSVTRPFLWPELEGFVKYIKEGDRVLDLGCGNGRLYQLFENKSTPRLSSEKNKRAKIFKRPKGAESIEYIGVDRSAGLIKSAREKWKNINAKFLVSDILDLSNFKKDSFDAVFLIAVLHHIPSRKLRLKTLKNIYSVLKPGGTIFITNWMFWQKKFYPFIFKYTILKLIGKNKMDFLDILIPWKSCGLKTYGHSEKMADRYYHVFTKRELKRLVKKTGFVIIKNKKAKWNYITICKK